MFYVVIQDKSDVAVIDAKTMVEQNPQTMRRRCPTLDPKTDHILTMTAEYSSASVAASSRCSGTGARRTWTHAAGLVYDSCDRGINRFVPLPLTGHSASLQNPCITIKVGESVRVWILVVEDEPAMRDALRQGLEEENHTVTVAANGMEGIHAAETLNLDAILLDVMMPGMSGIDLVRRLRAGGRQTPVLMLTARDAAYDVVRGLDAGADDYLTKPFSFNVLLARLRAISRRSAQPPKSKLQVADLILDPASREVCRNRGFARAHRDRIPSAGIPHAALGSRGFKIGHH